MQQTAAIREPKAQKDHRRQQLIDATIRTISEFGLSNTTVSKVTKNANLSAGIIGFYFNSKEQLLLGTLEFVDMEYKLLMEQAFSSGDSPEEIIRNVIDVSFSETLCDLDKIAVWQAFSSESRSRQEYMKICGNHEMEFHQQLLRQITALCENHPESNINPEAITRGLCGLIDNYWQEYLFSPENFDREQAKQICQDYLAAVFPVNFRNQSANLKPITIDQQTDLLAPWTYYDPEFLELEKEELFRKNWLLVGHISDIAQPRDYLTFDAVGERALIVRGHDNQLRAFHNVCRHRGAKLVENSQGQCPHALTCPFHGWTYQLDGSLIGVPAENTFTNFEKSENGLVPLDLEVWHGFIFIRFQSGISSLAETLKPIEELVAPYRMTDMQPISGTSYAEVRPYNWKVIHDIDNEGYHVPIGHPSLQQLYGKSYVDEKIEDISFSHAYLNDKPGKLWSVRHYQNLLPAFDHLPEDNQKRWLYFGIFPSMTIALYPDCIEFYMTLPVSTDQTVYRGGMYALPDDRPEINAVRYLNRRINQTTEQEDESYVRWLQQGMQSSAFPEPRLSSIEQGVRDFHKRLQKALPVAKLKDHPGQGMVKQKNQQLQ